MWNFDVFQNTSVNRQGASAPTDLPNFTLGLLTEAGEFGELIKKHLYHGKPLDVERCKDELSDVLWYLTMAAHTLGLSLSDIAWHNCQKLNYRYQNGFAAGRSDQV